MRLLVLAGYDSQLKWGKAVAAEFVRHGWEATYYVPKFRDNQLSKAQLDALDIRAPIERGDLLTPIHDARALSYDAIVVALNGGAVERFLYALRKKADSMSLVRRPITITGYVGIVIEGHIGGFMYRRLADLICTNSVHDTLLFRHLAQNVGVPQECIVHSGLVLTKNPLVPLKKWGKPQNILFAAQPTVPAQKPERLYILHKLIEYARAFPDRNIIFKPRHRIGEDTFHKEKYHYEELLRSHFHYREVPPNFILSYEPITSLLDTVDLCLSVSSTAVIEAYASGVPFSVLSDLGIKERYGTPFFLGSGALMSFEDLFADRFNSIDSRWISENVVSPGSPAKIIYARVNTLIAKQNSAKFPLPYHTPYGFTARQEVIVYTHEIFLHQRTPVKAKNSRFTRKVRKIICNPRAFFMDALRNRLDTL